MPTTLLPVMSAHRTPKEQCHNSNAHCELCPQEVCLRPYLPTVIASHTYFLNGRERGCVFVFMRLHHTSQWFFICPKKLYVSSCDSFFRGCNTYITHCYSAWLAGTAGNAVAVLQRQLSLKLNTSIYPHGGAQWFRHCATNWKVAGSIPDGVTGFFSLT
jgi:hypothetical protein